MKVLIADSLPESALRGLREAGLIALCEPSLQGEGLREALAAQQPDALIVRSTKVERAHLEASARLGLVVRAGAGVNTIDVAAAGERGIYVANCPGRNAIAVAELAWGLLLAADRQLPNAVRDLRAGQWRKKHYSQAQGLHGRTLGLIGLGNIGQAMASRALAFGMPVLAWSRSLTPARAQALGLGFAASPLEVAAQSYAVSVHVDRTPETRGMIDARFLEAMAPGAILINTSRGEVLDEAAALEAVRRKGLRCGLDVWCDEPSKGEVFETPLAREELVFGTCHIAASTEQAQDAVAAQAVHIVRAWKETGAVPCCVNLARRSAATHLLVVRHCDRVGVLARVLEALKRASINVQEMENVIFAGGKAAIARIRLGKAPGPETLQEIGASDDILALDLLPLEDSPS